MIFSTLLASVLAQNSTEEIHVYPLNYVYSDTTGTFNNHED